MYDDEKACSIFENIKSFFGFVGDGHIQHAFGLGPCWS